MSPLIKHSEIAVEIHHLSKSVADFEILKNISLSVKKGSICGIIGRSGAGKTTLMRCLNGLENPSSGHIVINGQDVTVLSKGQRRTLQQTIGTVFQQFHLLSRRTVFENVAFPLELQQTPQLIIQEKVDAVLSRVGLLEKASSYPHALSGGQCQRVAIARALVTNADLLLCDEFTSALDPETTMEILSLLLSLNQELGITIILITHDMAVVRELCDTVVVLENGECIEKGSVTSILLQPQHPVTQAFVRILFSKELPKSYVDRLKTMPSVSCQEVVQLLFTHDIAKEPIIATLVETCHVPVNIIAGHLDHIRQTAFGQLTLTFAHTPERRALIQHFLEKNHVTTQWLGYLHD